jgi:hypothetical protein
LRAAAPQLASPCPAAAPSPLTAPAAAAQICTIPLDTAKVRLQLQTAGSTKYK